VVFLSSEELQIFEKSIFTQPRLQLVKDLFVFCCYTGLAYNELSKLEHKHIQKGFDGMLWINMKREKTAKDFSIPLLLQAEVLINKHQSKKSLIFPKISNQKYNSYLKEIGAIIGIEKKLTTHVARKTFASTVLLYNDVPMEIVSELLGHSSMKITQDSYGKVVQKKISDQMTRLKKEFNKDFPDCVFFVYCFFML
jgi:integrase/recombinase XerD